MNAIKFEEFLQMGSSIKKIKELKDKTVIVTGATGLIASSLIDFLAWLNIEREFKTNIYAIVRNQQKAVKRFGKYSNEARINIVCCDVSIQYPEQLVGQQIDYVIHAASNAHPVAYATNPVDTMKSNILGTINYLEALKNSNLKSFLYISSSEIYGENPGEDTISEEYYGKVNTLLPRSCYSESKRAAETICISYSEQYNINTSIARIGYVFGPMINEDNSRADAQFLRKVLSGEDIVLKSKGEQKRSYCYIGDCITALLTILINGNKGEAYNVASKNNNITIFEYATKLAEHAGQNVVFQAPGDVENKGYSKVKNSILSVEKLEELGWREMFSLDQAISNMIEIAKAEL